MPPPLSCRVTCPPPKTRTHTHAPTATTHMLPPPWFSLQNAALLYFKRFFSQASCVEHDAMRVMATCVYLACKVRGLSGAQSAGSEGLVGPSVLAVRV